MKNGWTSLSFELPEVEAADLVMKAMIAGVTTSELLAHYVRKNAYGYAHPAVIEFESRPKDGSEG